VIDLSAYLVMNVSVIAIALKETAVVLSTTVIAAIVIRT